MSKINRNIQTNFSDDDNDANEPPPKKEPPNITLLSNSQPDRQPDKPPPGPSDNEAIPEPRVRPSRYITTTEDDKDSGFEKIAVYLSVFFVIITFPLSIFLCLIVVKEYHRVLVFRLGRVRKGIRGPGLVWTLPCIDDFIKVDLRTFSTEVPSQDILTRDSVTISVDAVLYYCIKDPMDALIQVDDAKEATVLIAQTTLRHIVGAKPLHTLLTSRDTLSREIQVAVDEITERWGEYHRVLVFRLGRVRKGIRGPGLVWTLPCIDDFIKVDLRTFSTEVPSQDILTRDSVTISVDAVLYYCIKDPMDALIQVDDAKEATVLIAQTTLRHIVGAKPLHTLLTSRDTLSREIQVAVDEITERWGVRVERVDVMDISLPLVMQRSLASEAEAVREARAKIISAEGELNASQALKEASDVMSQNKITLQLRHLQILTSIAAERRCRIIYPFPMEIMTPFMDGGGGGGGRSRGGTGNPGGKRRESILTNFFFGSKPETESNDKSSPLDPKADVAPNQAEFEQDPNHSSDTQGANESEMPGGSGTSGTEKPLANLAFMDILSYQQFMQNRR
ncbi:blast:Erythrocyte band 7 integral membrane protein [Drosophila guanche]|uniref:Blast:Erythrocyte band 7 integral membrane protein n=1 Tax=Drosophila guanche TaxID=7266 RepID=A0A3B0KDW6_DROGU|nr:blast:Erythrocyte band 7 integral membrane protein [Drosophila guanche]